MKYNKVSTHRAYVDPAIIGVRQEGGEPAGVPLEADQPEASPIEAILEMAMQAMQAQDCQAAMQVCGQLLEVAGVSGEAPAPAAPGPEAAPAPAAE